MMVIQITRITTVLSTYTSSISTNIIIILFLTVLERIFTVDGKSHLPVDFLVNNLRCHFHVEWNYD